MKKTIFVLVALFVSGCSDSDSARRALIANGFVDITTTGYSWFSCGNDDTFSTGFVATNAAGVRVKGVVCSGWLKGSTVRVF